TAHEMIKLTFTQAMDQAAVSVSGDIGTASPYWPPSGANKELDLNFNDATHPPTVVWNQGSGRKLVVTVKTGGETVTYTYTYTVFKGVCVSLPTNSPYPGASASPGTAFQPLDTFAAGIAKAKLLYIDTGKGPAVVAVAAGTTYTTNWAGDTSSQIKMVEGVSLLGGYAMDFKSRSSSPAITKVADISAAGTMTATYTIFCDNTITNSTTIDGLTVVGAGGLGWSFGIACAGGSPTISNNIVLAGPENSSQTDGNALRVAIEVGDSAFSGLAAPVISGNTINGDPGCGGLHVGQTAGVYLFAGRTGAADIVGNTIYGGTADDGTWGLSFSAAIASAIFSENISASVRIRNNVIQGGHASTGTGLHVILNPTAMMEVYNNLIFSGTCQTNSGMAAAVYLDSLVANVRLRNNTLVGTDHGTAVNQVICLYSNHANPVFDNNILLVQPTIQTNACYALYDTFATPSYSPKNDDYYVTDGTDVIYHHGTTDSTIPPGTGYTTVNPSLDSSYKPSSSVSAVCTGGLDGVPLSWPFTTDKDGVTRTGNGTTGWTMGCFEVN
ncbi:MAG: hypothetical protein NTW07_03825, partial [candidate division Zixibacteria bacterium]|nr:hypothetical protein [candidate division Zixibacteria bacterium]